MGKAAARDLLASLEGPSGHVLLSPSLSIPAQITSTLITFADFDHVPRIPK
jgi:hypothetical protein